MEEVGKEHRGRCEFDLLRGIVQGGSLGDCLTMEDGSGT